MEEERSARGGGGGLSFFNGGVQDQLMNGAEEITAKRNEERALHEHFFVTIPCVTFRRDANDI